MARQFNKVHAVTVVATIAIAAYRFINYLGGYAAASPAAGGQYAVGVSEEAASIDEAASAVTSYSYLVEASEAIALHSFVRPAADGSGKAAAGSATSHCGRALSAATAAGELVEVEILKHVHA